MNYYLIVIESASDSSKNLTAICRSEEKLNSAHPVPLISLMNQFLKCFLQKENKNNIGKISVYQLERVSIDFTNKYPSGSSYEEEDLATDKKYTVDVNATSQYTIINEGALIRQWGNYYDFDKEKERFLDSHNS